MSQLTTGLNLVSSFSVVPTNSDFSSISVEASVGETGVFVYGTNIQVYLADSSGSGEWSQYGTDFSSTDHEGRVVPWGSNDRMYIFDIAQVGGSVHALPRSDSTSVPTLSAFISSIEGLSDVPDYDSSDAEKYLAVNSDGTAIEFVDPPSGGGGSVTYNVTDYFVVEHEEHLTSGSGTLLMNSSNLYSGSAPELSANEPGSDAGSTLNVGAISIPSGSRIVGAEWRVLEAFADSSGSSPWQNYGAIDFGDGKKFTPAGRYSVTSFPTLTPATHLYSGNLYYIAQQTEPAQDFSNASASSNDVGTTFYAQSSDYSVFYDYSIDSGVIVYQLNSSGGIKDGDTVEFLSDGTLYYTEASSPYGSYTTTFQDIGAPAGIVSGETFVANLSSLDPAPASYDGVQLFGYDSGTGTTLAGAGARVATVVAGDFASESAGNFGPYLLGSDGVSAQGYINIPSYVPSVSGDIVPKLCWGASYSGSTPAVPASGMLVIRFVYI